MIDNTYNTDIKNIKDYQDGVLNIEWDIGESETLSRDRYLEYYEDNIYDMEPVKYDHSEYICFDSTRPEHDVILVYRVNYHHNEKLAENGGNQTINKIIVDYNGSMYCGSGYLFSTNCCDGWYYNQTRCACGVKMYMNIDNVNFLDMREVNLNSTNPCGYADNI